MITSIKYMYIGVTNKKGANLVFPSLLS